MPSRAAEGPVTANETVQVQTPTKTEVAYDAKLFEPVDVRDSAGVEGEPVQVASAGAARTLPKTASSMYAMGAAGLLGTWLFGRLVAHNLSATLILAPAGLAAIACGLVAAGMFAVPVAVLLIAWGMIGTGAPVAWWTWVARRFPNDAEAGGGLLVAVVQMAITLGAASGGLLFDLGGHAATFLVSAALLAGAALLAALDARSAGAPVPVPA